MKQNMGLADRYIRLLAAAVLIFLYFSGIVVGVWKIIIVVVAFILAATAVVAICPLYRLLGFNTCGKHIEKKNA